MNDGTSSQAPSPMSGNMEFSYPSPISTAASSDIQETTTQPMAEPHVQGRADTQHSLRAASAALQAAYRRIRQVRRSLVELTEPLPSLDSDAQNGGIGPGHSALLLTASPIEESSDTDDAIDLRALRSHLAAADGHTQYEYLDRFASTGDPWGDYQSPLTPPTAPDPPRPRRQVQLPSPAFSVESLNQPIIPRRSMLESQLARRREAVNPDDPATFIGRRVAAREAAGPSRPVDHPRLSHMDPVLRAVEMERELIHLRTLTHQRRTDPGLSARADALSRSEMLRAARSLDTETFRAGHRQPPNNISTNVPVHARPPPNARRWRAMRAAETRQSSSGSTQSPASAHPDRLSLLSNFSVQNLSTPTSAIARDRPLLFEEPLSYAPPANGNRRDSRDTVDSPIGSERSYFIHRRVNADGDELVHNINLEWDDEDPLSWLMPTRERLLNERQDYPSSVTRRRLAPPTFDERSEAVRGTRGQGSVVTPEIRRRGWARLDPDGNAIPSDEEEELERSRAEYRIRALYQARASAAAVTSSAERRAQSGIDVPGHLNFDSDRNAARFANLVTRTSISPDDYPTRESTSPRVRLNSRDSYPGQRLGFGTVLDSVLSVDNRPRQTQTNGSGMLIYGSSVPFVVDPLPIPLSDMMSKNTDQKGRLTGIRVSRHAGFAGR
ncbi:hypothetical protein B0H10DRAFT_1997236 [Mycena sp. CBHHK59/15]|nr:hypothetical protein B0H10DRAFT_1997236 [Mycena sp. CBHHK59/15]